MNDPARDRAGIARTSEAQGGSPPTGEHAGARPTAVRGRLFRKYLLLILSLVTIALLASGGTSIYFSYQENKAALASLQQEKAYAAASRIEQYIQQIVQQLAYASLPQLDPSDVELRRIEFLKLLRQAPEVTDITQLDPAGREQLAVSRLGMDVVGSAKDRSQDAAFRGARRGKPWFGPVYFRKETEPYMSVGLRSGSDSGPVTIAEVNLKFIWDVVSRIKIGEKGKAYVVDGNGFLVADPDIGLVLRKTNLSNLPHIKAGLESEASASPATLSTDLSGTQVLTALAPIQLLGWKVFVEQPVSEVYAKLDASVLRTGLLLLAGLVISALAALGLARGMVKPIRTLEQGALRIGSGDLDQTIDVRTGDELEALAGQFNRMTGQLRESYAGLERKVEERTRELRDSLDQQTAISEILRVISSSPTDVQPVLDVVAERAAHLCGATVASVLLIHDNQLRPMASYSTDSGSSPTYEYRIPLQRDYITGRAAVDRTTVNLADVVPLLDSEFAGARDNQHRLGFRAVLAVPLMRDAQSYGVIYLYRRDPRAFAPDQVALVETFARQAAIAIDNVRLFNETKEALQQQTAIAEILRVISGSPTDVQPVLDAIAEHAARLCDASAASMYLTDGSELRHLASKGAAADPLTQVERLTISRDSIAGRALLEGKTVEVRDMFAEGSEFPISHAIARRLGHRSMVATPLFREGHAFGVILLRRQEPRPFNEREIALLQTFGDQAAIALENVRLFNETEEALQQQTAISEILRVISSSPTDVAPVLRAVAERAARICEADDSRILLAEDGNLRVTTVDDALEGPAEGFVHPIERGWVAGRAYVDRQPVHVHDLQAEDAAREFPAGHRIAVQFGVRTTLAVPLLRERQALGVILLRRSTARPFDEKHIGLLRTFADQAAIAIENVRLFNETREALDQQRASGEVLAAISNSIADTKPVFDTILQSCQHLFAGETVGLTLVRDDGLLDIGAYAGPGREDLRKVFPQPLTRDTASGIAILERTVVTYPDVDSGEMPPASRDGCHAIGLQSMSFAPMLSEGRAIGTLWVGRTFKGPFSDKQLALLKTFAEQAVIAIQNARLFREIEDKSRQLEIANRHKSEFLANMSHELRTPLNAIIGFSEVLLERLFGDVNEKQEDYLRDIHSSGKHLLGLINDILDLSKIEAGRMELEISSFDLPAALSNALTLVRERAQRHAIALGLDVDPQLGDIAADERKLKQIMLNLLSNAVKFTPDGGRVDVIARREAGRVTIAVRDTGIGIAPQDQAAVFEEFRQVGSDYTRKQEGTGLGLALARRFVELHGGHIKLESEPGEGSTFTFDIPLPT